MKTNKVMNCKTVLLKDLVLGEKGSYGIGAPAVDYDPKKYTYLRITDINDDGSINTNGLKSVDAEDAYKYILQENDIVFARTGASTGKTYFYQPQDGTLVYAGFLIKFSIDPQKVNPRLLKYITHSQEYYNWVRSFDTGGTRGNINAVTFANMPITLPDRATQDRIVAILSSIDDKIELNRRINANLEQQAQALYKSWFVDFEPFGGKMPEDWREGTLGEIMTITSGKHPKNRVSIKTKDVNIPIVGAADIIGYTNEMLYSTPILIIGRVGTHGIVQRFSTKCWPSDNTLVIQTKYYEMCYQLLKQIDYKKLNRGSTQPLITQTDIKGVEVIIPPIEILEEYENRVSILFHSINNYDIENSTLSALRDTLLPKLMSGEITV